MFYLLPHWCTNYAQQSSFCFVGFSFKLTITKADAMNWLKNGKAKISMYSEMFKQRGLNFVILRNLDANTVEKKLNLAIFEHAFYICNMIYGVLLLTL